MKIQGYGLPLRCPKCPEGAYFGMLKVPGNKAVPCVNCGTPLVSVRKYAAIVRPPSGEKYE
jgi:uncharacterized protein (DUF983 family)